MIFTNDIGKEIYRLLGGDLFFIRTGVSSMKYNERGVVYTFPSALMRKSGNIVDIHLQIDGLYELTYKKSNSQTKEVSVINYKKDILPMNLKDVFYEMISIPK